MKYYCLEEFKAEFERLIKKKSYRSLERDMIEAFFDKSIGELRAGTRLNNSSEAPFIKKRVGGSGGFRFYYYLLIDRERLYFLFVHPKTGPLGSENITDESKAYIYKGVLEAIKVNELYSVEKSSDGKSLQFRSFQS